MERLLLLTMLWYVQLGGSRLFDIIKFTTSCLTLTEVCHNGAIEPSLQSLSGETFPTVQLMLRIVLMLMSNQGVLMAHQDAFFDVGRRAIR